MVKVCVSGLGDIGNRLAARWLDSGAEVYGIKRGAIESGDEKLAAIKLVNADLDDPSSLSNLPTQDSILYHLAPPPSQGETDTRFRALLDSTAQNGLPKKVILLSTTAVYGDCNGEWITEDAPVNPQTTRGQRRLDAENALREWAQQTKVPFAILRVSGIYGPGRLPVERIKQGLPILREDLAPFSNRIHADDLALACFAAGEKAPDGAVYNVCDGKPSTMSHYFKAIAKAFDLPVPPEIDREEAQKVLSPGMLSYLKESRRMSNDKMIKELGIELRYPNLEVGLADLKDK